MEIEEILLIAISVKLLIRLGCKYKTLLLIQRLISYVQWNSTVKC
jgi:hypothetical protein